MAQYFFTFFIIMLYFYFIFLFKERVSNMRLLAGPQRTDTLLITHKGMLSSTQTCKIFKIKGLQCKRLLLCKLHKYKNAYKP